MRLLIQRVSRARVAVDGETVGRIDRGLLVLVGVESSDGPEQASVAAEKVAGLRVFADAAGKMNLDVRQAGGAVLVVSQFTLAASLARGRRPSFEGAAPPDRARELVDRFAADLAGHDVPVRRGRFGAYMEVELVNDGPVTFVLDVASGPRTA